ncbi:helix-turn-helix domain-containing protein [Mesorhizobium sp. CA8]|uniref:helix-turn-helix domain-containing protein n=1 Tax=unclassified Mesorhizobium TaxID=325217 RepID=UPI001CCEBBA3|nr:MULTISPECIES: helix-turn-helix transcriptional regulator [unclassified Mesorhizobium]MBZ9764801.1 helix-turn-helix domain-containing protein [Mesorhizobium sp. CA8]MBZ9822763.1 helix-turn-helix domain-containing protein [Mesorhizobium sp. CA4]
MKLAITKEWFERRVKLEGDHEIAAGALARDPAPEAEASVASESIDAVRLAFGSLIESLRRRKGLTIEKLAERSEIDVADIVRIERDAHFRPEPRAVYRLAQAFDLPNKALQQLSGNTSAQPEMQEHALRFAARSGESPQKLSRDEKKALEEFVAYLARQ